MVSLLNPLLLVAGKMVNEDVNLNVTTTEAHCYECHYDFVIKECAGEVWTEE